MSKGETLQRNKNGQECDFVTGSAGNSQGLIASGGY